MNKRNSRQLYGFPSKLIPNYKTETIGQCSCPPNGDYCDCEPEYKPRNKGRCGMRRVRFPAPRDDLSKDGVSNYYQRDDAWKYGYFTHRLSAFGPGASWKNGVGEVAIYGPKFGLEQQDKQIQSQKPEQRENFAFGYGSGNDLAYNYPEDYDHSCGFKPYMLYG